MAINTQLWVKDFARNLYDDSDWFSFGKNFNDAVNNSIVHIPQAVAGTAPVEVDGATVFPIAATQNSYDDLTFTMKMVAAAPKYTHNIDWSEASFNTKDEMLKEIAGSMKQAISIEIADKWTVVSTGSTLATTGTVLRNNIYGQASVKSLTFSDIMLARTNLIKNTKNVNLNKLYLVVDPVLYADLVQLDQFENADNLTNQTVVNAIVGTIGGFKVVQRGMGIPITSAGAKATID